MIRFHLKNMFSRKETKFAFTFMIGLILISTIENSLNMYGMDISKIYSPANGWVGYADILQIQSFQIFYVILIFIISAIVYSDIPLVNKKNNISNIIIARSNRGKYYISGAIATFIGAFAVIFVPLIISQCISLVMFPFSGKNIDLINTPSWNFFIDDKNWLFPSIFYNHTYLYNFIFIFYASLVSGIFSFLSYSIAMCIRKAKLIAICIPTLLVLLFGTLNPLYSISYYIYPSFGFSLRSYEVFFFVPIIVLVISIIIFTFKLLIKQEDL